MYERVCVCFTHTLTHTTVRRGVVVGWDAQCCEADEWAEAAGVSALSKGPKQPFYQILVDVRDWSFDFALPPVAYAGVCVCVCVCVCGWCGLWLCGWCGLWVCGWCGLWVCG